MRKINLLSVFAGISLMLSAAGTASAQYCTTAASNCNLDDEIINVTFAGINNTSTCSANGYQDYTALTPGSLMTGSLYPVSVEVGPGGNEAIAVWIDYNQNDTFDMSEFTYVGNVSGGIATANITVPLTALAGNTRMRVRSYYVASGDPLTIYNTTANSSCAAISTNFGETEDYTVTIIAGTNCSGTPDAGTATSTETAVCPGTSFSLNTTGGTVAIGLSYQWQSSPDAITWTNLGAAQPAASYMVPGISANTSYRVIVICPAGGVADTSTVVAVSLNAIGACYCEPLLDCTDGDLITNVTFESISNPTACGTDGYNDFTGTIAAPNVQQGQPYVISVTVGGGFANESVSVWVDNNQNGLFEQTEFTYIGTGSASVVSDTVVIDPAALTGNTRMRVRVAAVSVATATWDMSCDEDQVYGETEDYLVNIIAAGGGVDSLMVTTAGSVPAVIPTPTGTLQLVSTVYPLTESQAVTWTIIPVTGAATIDGAGLVTAQTAGTVWAKAVSVADVTKADSIEITIDPLPGGGVDSVVVTTSGGVAAQIIGISSTLQVEAAVYPLTESQAVTWSIIPGTGAATIDPAGLITSAALGTVWAKAVAVADPTMMDSLEVTIMPGSGLGGELLNNLAVYPNPAQDVIFLTAGTGHDVLQLSVIDINGRVVHTQTLLKDALTGQVAVNMTNYAPGVYALRLQGAGISISKQVIKE